MAKAKSSSKPATKSSSGKAEAKQVVAPATAASSAAASTAKSSVKKKPGMIKRIWRFFKRRWYIWLILLLILGGGGVSAYKKQQSSQVDMVFISPERKDLVKTLDLSCTVDAKERARLRFIAGGKVTYIGAKEGDWVKKYQTVARIDPRTLQKQLEQNLNNYMQERWNWDQTLDDTKDRVLPKEEQRSVDQKQWTLDNQVLNVEIKDIAVSETALTSPIEGVLVTAPSAVAGVQLTAADYFEVVNPETLVCKAAVDEVDIAPVALGLPVTLSLDSYPDETLESSVSYISPTSALADTGTVFIVESPLPKASDLSKYRLGMNGDASITLQTKPDVLVIPLEATREVNGKTYVDVKETDTTTTEREITTGLETDDEVEVLSGLTEQDLLLLPQ